jgi:hypothetical protein
MKKTRSRKSRDTVPLKGEKGAKSGGSDPHENCPIRSGLKIPDQTRPKIVGSAWIQIHKIAFYAVLFLLTDR